MELKRSPGRPLTGNAKVKVTIRLPQELVEWIDKQTDEQNDRTLVITKLLLERKQ